MKTFLKLTIAVVVASLSTAVAYAETYNYSCKADGKTYPLRVDDNQNVLEWKGVVYNIKDKEDCGRAGWHAEGNGRSFDFCTATQGYAAIQDKDGNVQVQCDIRRR
jgi:hypothetical protein